MSMHAHACPVNPMLSGRTARIGVMLVIVASVAGAVFRVTTAPQRAKERRETARTTCVANGGEWISNARGDELCRRPAGKP